MFSPMSIAFLVLGCVTTWTNCTFMVVIWKNKKLHTATNWLLFSLSISDVCVGGLSAPFLAGLIIFTTMDAGTSTGCLVMVLCLLVFPCISVAHLVVVTVERYVTIIYPLRSLSIITPRRLVYAIILCWTSPVTMFSTISPTWTKLDTDIGNASNFTCSLQTVIPCYVFDSLLSGVIACYIITNVMYARIFFVAVSQARRVAAERRFGGPTQTRISILRSHLRSTFLIFVAVGVFAFSYFPLALSLVDQCANAGDTEDTLIWQIFSFLAFANSAVNPLIYGLGNRTIRHILLKGPWGPCRYFKRNNHTIDIATFDDRTPRYTR